MTDVVKLSEYRDWLRELKLQIKTGQVKAAISVNSQLILLYWDLGRQIAEKQETAQWGSGFITQLSKDLRDEFPEMSGLSYDNLRFAKRFYLFYSQISEQVVPISKNPIVAQLVQQLENCDGQFSEQLVPKLQHIDSKEDIKTEQAVRQLALVPWGHHMLILKRIKDIKQALFYINKTIENNWSRSVLEYQIETNLYGRQSGHGMIAEVKAGMERKRNDGMCQLSFAKKALKIFPFHSEKEQVNP